MEGSFDLDAYEIHDGEEDRNSRFWILQGGVVEGVPTTGFTFLDPDADGHRISGPLTALLAVEELS